MPKKSKKIASGSLHFRVLKKHWQSKHKALKHNVRVKHREAFEWMGEKVPAREHVAGLAMGAIMLGNTLPAVTAATTPTVEARDEEQFAKVDKTVLLLSHLGATLPAEVKPLSVEQEAAISQILSEDFGIQVSAELEGKRLNRSYGYIGAEQHLMRYPGDIMHSHLPPDEAKDKYIYSSGMAPGRGAWGYFARSKAEMTQQDVEREKWYIAAPTFLAPGFMENVNHQYQWFKYRKMLVVNPKTGQAVVTVIGDAGPAAWTGKHLGGSPEVMIELGLHTGPRKGAVLYYFVNDPDNKIPLGPVKAGDYNLVRGEVSQK